MPGSRSMKARSARATARRWSPRPGSIRPTSSACSSDGSKAIGELDFLGRQGQHIVAVENTPEVHNLVVCTLCSCYPLSVLGLPPAWYKSAPYRSRAVIDPRGVLKEFGAGAAGAGQDPRLGFDRGGALPGAAGAARRHGEDERGAAGRLGDARCHDRRRQGLGEVNSIHDLGGMHGFGAIDAERERAAVP